MKNEKNKEISDIVTELRKHNWDKEWYENNREHLNCNPRYNPAHWNQ